MKKKGLLALLLAVICLLTVACGKEEKDDKKDSKKEEKTVQTLKCSTEEGDEKIEMSIQYDTKSFEFKNITMETTFPKSMYKDLVKNDEDFEKILCADDTMGQSSCKVKVDGEKVIATLGFDPKDYGEELLDDSDIEKPDANTLKDLKEDMEKESGVTCTIS